MATRALLRKLRKLRKLRTCFDFFFVLVALFFLRRFLVVRLRLFFSFLARLGQCWVHGEENIVVAGGCMPHTIHARS